MSLQACANAVSRADPERFKAAMAAPMAARRVLLPIYAANLEIAKGPWVTKEPLIAEMRLQWWRDVLDEIDAGHARRHEVVDALANVLDHTSTGPLRDAIAARMWDIYRDPFTSPKAFVDYVQATTLGTLGTSYLAFGAGDIEEVHHMAAVTGLARFAKSVPRLIEAGATPFGLTWSQDMAADAISIVAEKGKNSRPKKSAALIEAAGSKRVCRFLQNHPEALLTGDIPDFPLVTAMDRAKRAWRLR